MGTTIESLELQVQSSSSSAVSGIDALSASLAKLKTATKGGVGLTSVANSVRSLNSALSSVESGSADKISKLADSLSKLSSIGKISISSSIGNQIKNISSAASALDGADFTGLTNLSSALQPLNEMGKATGLQSTITQLKKLPELANTLNAMDWSAFRSQIQQIVDTLSPLTTQLNTVSTAFSKLPTNINKAVTATKKVPSVNTKAATSYTNFAAKILVAYNAVKRLANVIASWINESNSYVESLNLFTASLGEYAEEAQAYAEQVSELMGIDPADWMENQGVFNTIITGFGVASDKAYTMSKNLTQLGYDLSSFFNISVEDAMQKLESGISGELEPLRRLGYDLSVARLQQEALNLGIEKSVSEMTQAEKSQLRYYAIMTQVTVAQGDMARTLEAPANQLRVLKAQVTQCARALGNIFIPALNAVLPYAIALVKVLRMLAQEIANFFGFTLPEVDYSSITSGSSAVSDLADDADDAASGLSDSASAASKLKKSLLGFDELNMLSDNSGSSSGSGSGSGTDVGVSSSDLGIDLPTYDFLDSLVSTRVDEIVEMITSSLTEIEAIISTFMLAIGTILVVTGNNIPLGVALMAAGAVGLVSVISDNWDGMSEELARVLTVLTGVIGGFLLAIGAFIALSGVNVPLGIALIAAGAVALGTAATINWKFLEGDLTNALSILVAVVGGAMLAIGALFALTGVDVPLGIGLMAAGAVSLVTAAALNWDSLTTPVKKVIGVLEGIVGGALLAIGIILATGSGATAALGVALIAAGAVSLVSAVVLNWDSLTGDIKETLATITAIVSGALIGIGAILALTHVNLPLGIALIAAGAAGIVATAAVNWSSLTTKIKTVLQEIGIAVGAALLAIGAILAFSFAALPLGIGLMAAGAASLVTGVVLNWDGILDCVKTAINDLLNWIQSTAMLALGVILCLSGIGIGLGIELIAEALGSQANSTSPDWSILTDKIKKVFTDIGDTVSAWVSKIGDTMSALGEMVAAIVNPMDGISAEDAVSNFQVEVSAIWAEDEKTSEVVNVMTEDEKELLAKATANVTSGFSQFNSDWQGLTKNPTTTATVKANLMNGTVQTDAKTALLADSKTVTTTASIKKSSTWIEEGYKVVTAGNKTVTDTIKLSASGWNTSSAVYQPLTASNKTVTTTEKLSASGWNTSSATYKAITASTHTVTINAKIGSTVQLKKLVSGSATLKISANGQVISGATMSVAAQGGVIGPNGLIPFASGGVIGSSGWYKRLNKYASGTRNAHGTMFVAGEAGPEIVGHIGGRTEVLNQSQLAGTMYSAVSDAMSRFVNCWNAISQTIALCATAIIQAIPDNTTVVYSPALVAAGVVGMGDESADSDTATQISEGIREGLYEATARQNELLRRQNELLQELVDKDNTTEITTNSLTRALNRKNRRDGKTTVSVQV